MSIENKKKNFNRAVLAVFVILGVVGFGLFSINGRKNSSSSGQQTVTMWGFFPEVAFSDVRGALLAKETNIDLLYRQKNIETYEQELIEALASGVGPDLVILPTDIILSQHDKFSRVSYETLPRSMYGKAFIDGAEIFAQPDGIIAYPLYVDPMVLYFNRNHLASEFIVSPPKTWKELVNLVPTLRRLGVTGSIQRSAVALGTAVNIEHGKDLFTMMVLQTGNKVVTSYEGPEGGDGKRKVSFASTLAQNQVGQAPTLDILNFFSSFGDSSKASYTWNPSLKSAQDAFASNELTFYFGYSSEYDVIRRKNPNLNFDISMVPQFSEDGNKITIGKYYGIAQLKSSQSSVAQKTASLISKRGNVELMRNRHPFVPVSRSIHLSSKPTDSVQANFWESALISRDWLDPDEKKTDDAFTLLLRNLTSGVMRPSDALAEYNNSLRYILEQKFGII